MPGFPDDYYDGASDVQHDLPPVVLPPAGPKKKNGWDWLFIAIPLLLLAAATQDGKPKKKKRK